MSNIIEPRKVRVCFLCKQYTIIYPDNPTNLKFIKDFDAWHDKHPLQTVNVNEVDNSYTLISEKGRKKALAEILENKKVMI